MTRKEQAEKLLTIAEMIELADLLYDNYKDMIEMFRIATYEEGYYKYRHKIDINRRAKERLIQRYNQLKYINL